MDKEQLYFFLLEGFLLEYIGGSGKSKNYMPIQLLIMFLISKSSGIDMKKLGTNVFGEIGKAYPIAVAQTIGDDANLDKINVPPQSMMSLPKMPEIYNSLENNDKIIINNIRDKVISILNTKAVPNAG